MEAKEEFMERAIKLARESAKNGDYPIGAVVIKNDEVIASGLTNLKHAKDPTAHAEILAIRNACKKMGSGYLEDCVLYSTHEPCPMCASAAILAKMDGIVFGVPMEDIKVKQIEKFSWRQINIPCRDVLKHGEPRLQLIGGFLRDECLKLLDLVK